jgi:hypothetical protein
VGEPELPALLGVKPVRSELAYLLVSLDQKYTVPEGQPWEHYNDQKVRDHLGPPGT